MDRDRVTDVCPGVKAEVPAPTTSKTPFNFKLGLSLQQLFNASSDLTVILACQQKGIGVNSSHKLRANASTPALLVR